MKESISRMHQLAAGLKTALITSAVCKEPTTHVQCLELIARATGSPSWAAARRKAWYGWAYAQHLPYLPNPLPVVQRLATRNAVWQDVAAQSDAADETIGEIRASMRRALGQIAAVLSGQPTPQEAVASGRIQPAGQPRLTRALRVAPELSMALARGLQSGAPELEEEAAGAFEDARAFVAQFGERPMTAFNAERYQQRYLDWRLAQLSLYLAQVLAAPDAFRMEALLQSGLGINVFGFVALAADTPHRVLAMGFDDLAEACAQVRRVDILRYQTAKNALLTTLAHPLPWQPENKLEQAAAELFPEIALWHVWVELKPLLARGIDEAYRDLARVKPTAVPAVVALAQACTAAEDAALLADGPELARRLNATAQGVRFHEEALRACLLMPDLPDQDRLLLKRWLVGDSRSGDHFRLQDLAIRVLAPHTNR